jgi:hypothetical protein
VVAVEVEYSMTTAHIKVVPVEAAVPAVCVLVLCHLLLVHLIQLPLDLAALEVIYISPVQTGLIVQYLL